MGEEPGAEHGLDDGGGVAGLTGLGCGDGKEAEGVGVEVAELALIAEAGDDGLGAREAGAGVLVRQLRKQAAEASGIGEVGVLGVENPSLFCFSLAEEGQKLLVFIGYWCVAVVVIGGGDGGESEVCGWVGGGGGGGVESKEGGGGNGGGKRDPVESERVGKRVRNGG